MRSRKTASDTEGPTNSDISGAESHPGSALFCELAGVIAALAEHESLRSFTLPYPSAAQRALDRTVLHCLQLGEPPPRSLPELWAWCRWRSAGDSLFQVPASLVTPDATLVHPVGLAPTRTCLELTSHMPEGGVEREARVLLAGLAARCGSTEQYQRCRRFLACHPVVHQQDRFAGGWSKAVWSRVKEFYRPLPESLLAGGTFLNCLVCGLPALLRDRKVPDQGAPVAGPDTWCEGEVCPHGERLGLIRDPDRSWLLRRGLRAFLALPRRVEETALDRLERAGIGYEALPDGLGTYRLRGTRTGSRHIQVYDRVQPALLAARCIERETSLPDLMLVVVAQRFADCHDYRGSFTAALPDELRDRVLLTGPRDLAHHAVAQSAFGVHEGKVPDSTEEAEGDHA